MILYILEDIEGLNDLWVIGDNFTTTTYREHFTKRNMNWFMRDNFELVFFSKSRFNSNNPNMLSRLVNSLITAVNSRVKLPKVMVILLQQDFIEALQYDDSHVTISASLYGTWIEWLAEQIMNIINDANQRLPVKAQRPPEEPIIYWSATPSHKNFSFQLRAQIAKFNNCLESVMKLHKSMRLIKIKEGWDTEDSNLVTTQGRVTHQGIDQIWEALDSSVKFNYMKHMEYLPRNAGISQKPAEEIHHGQQKDPMIGFFQKNQIYHGNNSIWNKGFRDCEDVHHRINRRPGNRFLLPRIQ